MVPGPIVVIGATGRQGGSVVRHLLTNSATVRALTRKPDGRSARELADKGAEVLRGDMDDDGSLKTAMAGAYGVYSVQAFWTVGGRREVTQGKNVADAARTAGIEHLVYSSVGGAECNARIDHWDSKWEIERHIRRLGLPTTILPPASFVENYYIPAVEKWLLKGRLIDPVKADKPYQTIASDDIGKFVALAFERPEEFVGIELEIASSELTNRQAADVRARVLGRPVKFQALADANRPRRARQRVFPDVPLVQRKRLPRRRRSPSGSLQQARAAKARGLAARRRLGEQADDYLKRDNIGRPLTQT